MKCLNQRCTVDYTPSDAEQKYCSRGCANLGRMKLDLPKLQSFVRDGTPKAQIARAMGVNLSTVQAWMNRNGLEQEWHRNRWGEDRRAS